MEYKSIVKWDLEHEMILFFITLSQRNLLGCFVHDIKPFVLSIHVGKFKKNKKEMSNFSSQHFRCFKEFQKLPKEYNQVAKILLNVFNNWMVISIFVDLSVSLQNIEGIVQVWFKLYDREGGGQRAEDSEGLKYCRLSKYEHSHLSIFVAIISGSF